MADSKMATEHVVSCSGNDVSADICEKSDSANSNQVNKLNVDEAVSSSDAISGLNWNNGVGTLPGTNIKFRMNKSGDVEMLSDQEEDSLDENHEAKDPNHLSDASNDALVIDDKEAEDMEWKSEKNINITANSSNKVDVKEAKTKNHISETQSPTTVAKKSKQEGRIAVCMFCHKTGDISTFCGKFCTKQCVAKNAAKHKQKHAKSSLLSKKIDRKRPSSSENTNIHSFISENESGNMKIKIRRNLSGQEEDKDYEPTISKRRHTVATVTPQRFKLESFWKSYLDSENAVAAPVEIFEKLTNQPAFPTKSNKFAIGWLLEAVDPFHQSLIALVSVTNIIGHRLRLHFEGFPSIYDFWVNADSPYIFPCGFCEKSGRRLSPPCGYNPNIFKWKDYVKEGNLKVAPDDVFNEVSFENKTGFRVSDRIEAVDRQHPELTCVASIADTMGSHVLVHFDGWNSCYDYWTLHTSNYIRPVGWCETNGKVLTPPLGFDEKKSFEWKSYLDSSNFKAADSSLFSNKKHGFEVGMKLEVVDQRNPILIRVGSISAIDEYRVQIHPDGWSDLYDFWLDVDSRDLHPVNWCRHTKEDLQCPTDINAFSDDELSGCPVPGCIGLGHVKHDRYMSHHSEFGCPYSPQNLHREPMPDRLIYDKSSSHDDVTVDGNNNTKENATVIVRRKRGRPRIYSQVSQRDRKLSRESACTKTSQYSNGNNKPSHNLRLRSPKLSNFNFHSSIYEAAVMTSLSERQHQRELALGWNQHVLSLPGVKDKNAQQVGLWSAEQVCSFVNQLTGKSECGDIFVAQEIDGEAFLMLTQSDISSVLNLKLGPSVKIYNAILKIKTTEKVQT